MHYGPKTLNNNWHSDREAEPKEKFLLFRVCSSDPSLFLRHFKSLLSSRDAQKLEKDYDVTAVSDRNRNQHLATYKTIGFDKPTIPISTTKEGLEQTFKQKRFHEPLSKTTVIRIFRKMGLELCF